MLHKVRPDSGLLRELITFNWKREYVAVIISFVVIENQ